MANARRHAEEISKLEEEFQALCERLKATSDSSERELLLQDVSMLIQSVHRLINQHDERRREIRKEPCKKHVTPKD